MNSEYLDGGYTLIELVVALLLLSFIAIAISGGVQFGSRVWEHSQAKLAISDNVAMAQHIVRLVLGAATPRYQGGFVSFNGTPSSIDFDGEPPLAFPAGGLAHFHLQTRNAAGNTGLSLQASAIVDARFERKADLITNIGTLHFSYLDAEEKVPTWLAYWRDRDRLPDAVRIEADNSSTWPALIVALPIAESSNCIFDPVSLICRKP
jgi:prepilin-type N-terminal cleavage/methylation domain-containing protein